MSISPFFRHLRSAYEAEIDDLTFDSDGVHILQKRLTQRRKEMEFLVHMIELSPEMVAVVFHQAFRFKSPAMMEHLVSLESDELPEWDEVQTAVDVAPWAQELLASMRKQALGDWLLAVAATLEYLLHKPDSSQAAQQDAAEDEGADHAEDDELLGHQLDSDNVREPHDREEAGADWMAEQGFDCKD